MFSILVNNQIIFLFAIECLHKDDTSRIIQLKRT